MAKNLKELLKDTADFLRNKNQNKLATLIESNTGYEYLVSLFNPAWEKEAKAVFEDRYNPSFFLANQINGKYNLKMNDFNVGEQPSSSIDLKFDNVKITPEYLMCVADLSGKIIDISKKAKSLIYDSVKNLSDDQIFDIYKDWDYFYSRRNDNLADVSDDDVEQFKRTILSNKNNLKKAIDSKIDFLIDMNVTNLFRKLEGMISDSDKENDYAGLIKAAESISDYKSLLIDYNERESSVESIRERVIYAGKNIIDILTVKDVSMFDSSFLYGFFDFFGIDSSKCNKLSDYFSLLLSSSKDIKTDFVDDHYDVFCNDIKSTSVGLSQILAGGNVINPDAHPCSVLQNDAHFPNIKYNKKTLDKLNKLNSELSELLEQLPDLSDIVASGKLKNKSELSYYVKELDKNPFDVTFGNDSGCCLFVPDELKNLHNGIFVPRYLLDSGVRLFGVYLKRENIDQRMGLVLAFDSNLDDKKILACNSLELSRYGLKGGKKTIKSLVDFVENWLVDYASLNNYDGVSMGSHSYNTSKNHSACSSDIVKDQITFNPFNNLFYSDIFEVKDKSLVSRENSCYWLKRPEII